VVVGSALIVSSALVSAYLYQFGASCYGPQVFGVEWLDSRQGIDAFGSSIEQTQQIIDDAKSPNSHASPSFIKGEERILDQQLLCHAKTNALVIEICFIALAAFLIGISWVTGRSPLVWLS
jgi:hypothetical protein